MLDLLQRLLSLAWLRHGAALRELPVAGSRIWYADFAAREEWREAAHQPSAPRTARRRRPGAKRRPTHGRPPVLILLHGLGGMATSFHPLVSRLRLGYRVIVPDLPGYGRSRPPAGRDFLPFPDLVATVERFIIRVSPRGVYLAGNSMGGWIATKLAARRPDLVHGIALLNPGGPALKVEDWAEFAHLIAAEDGDAMAQFFSRLFHRPPFGVQLFARDFRRIMRGAAVAQLIQTLTPEDFLSEAELKKVRCPAVLVWGEEDRLIPEGCRTFFLEKLPRLRYEPVPDCGHCPQLECPARTAEILLQLPWLAERGSEAA